MTRTLPKQDFAFCLYSYLSPEDHFHADILALMRANGTIELEEAKCLYTPVNEMASPSEMVQYTGERQIIQYLNRRKQVEPPFRIYLQAGEAGVFYQSEEHYEQGKNVRCLQITARSGEAQSTLHQLQALGVEIAGETAGFQQLAALGKLSERFSDRYDIRMVVSSVFLTHINHEVDAMNLWDEIRGVMHGGEIPREWPCRKESTVELQLDDATSGLSYRIALETENMLKEGNRLPRRVWSISEYIGKADSAKKPVLQSKELAPQRLKPRLEACRHPFAKEILAL